MSLDWSTVPRHEPGEVRRVPRHAAVWPTCGRCGKRLWQRQEQWCSHRCAKYAWWWAQQLNRYDFPDTATPSTLHDSDVAGVA